MHALFQGNASYAASTLKHPIPRVLAYHPDLIAKLRPARIRDLQDMAIQLARVSVGKSVEGGACQDPGSAGHGVPAGTGKCGE